MHFNHLNNFLGGVLVAQKKKLIKYEYTPSSTFLKRNVELLVREGYFFSFTETTTAAVSLPQQKSQKTITVWLKYQMDGVPAVNNLKLYYCVRNPRVVTSKKVLQLACRSQATYVLSTSQGVRDLRYCLFNNLGGILLYSII